MWKKKHVEKKTRWSMAEYFACTFFFAKVYFIEHSHNLLSERIATCSRCTVKPFLLTGPFLCLVKWQTWVTDTPPLTPRSCRDRRLIESSPLQASAHTPKNLILPAQYAAAPSCFNNHRICVCAKSQPHFHHSSFHQVLFVNPTPLIHHRDLLLSNDY